MPRTDEEDYRWFRIGWFDQERPCDAVVQCVTAQLPGETMPARWSASNPTLFVKKYGEGVKWCRTASYHMLIVNGFPVLRIWTNTDQKVLMEIADRLVPSVRTNIGGLQAIPDGTKKKRKEFSWRFAVKRTVEVNYLVALVKVIYGVG